MPKIAEQLERLNDNLEELLDELRKLHGRATPTAACSQQTDPR